MWGSFDFPHIQERSRRVSTLIRAGVGKEVPDAAHLPSVDQPEVISRLLADFI
ncbi:MAG: alpha/beta fold hydrolase [Achromobacter marplatensis]|uniref:alpha/beta fold hydrolase n=1 Tax=Achromobacter marplatensis TaxID=470868 RepID=UPI003CFE293A